MTGVLGLAGFFVGALLCGIMFWCCRAYLSVQRAVFVFLSIHILVFYSSVELHDWLYQQQLSITSSLTPSIGRETTEWKRLEMAHTFRVGANWAIFAAPILVAIWGLRHRVVWAVVPLGIWAAGTIFAILAMAGWVGIPNGVLG